MATKNYSVHLNNILASDCQLPVPIEEAYLKIEDVFEPLLIQVARQNPSICVNPELFINIEPSGYVNIVKDDPNYYDRCRNNPDQRYTFISIGIMFYQSFYEKNPNEDQPNPGDERFGHATNIIIDHQNKTIEYYEPNGPADLEWHPRVQKFLQKHFSKEYPDYKFIPAENYCSPIGPQGIAGVPYCVVFSFFHLWSRIIAPDLDVEEFIMDLVSRSQSQLQDIIIRFICQLYNYAQSMNLFQIYEHYQRITEQNIHSMDVYRSVQEEYFNNRLQNLVQLGQIIQQANRLRRQFLQYLKEAPPNFNRNVFTTELQHLYDRLDVDGITNFIKYLLYLYSIHNSPKT